MGFVAFDVGHRDGHQRSALGAVGQSEGVPVTIELPEPLSGVAQADTLL